MRLRRRARFGAAPALHRPLRHAPKASLTRPYPSVLSSRTASPSRARLDLEDDASAIASTERSTVLTVLHQQLLVVYDGDVLLRQVADLPVLDLPQLLGDLRDET